MESPLTARVGQRIRDVRLGLGKKLAAVGAVSGMSEANLSRLERGLIPVRLDQVEDLAAALGVDPGVLLKDPPRKSQRRRRA